MDEDDLKWVGDKGKNIVSIKQFHDNFSSKNLDSRKLSYYSEMQNDALMHREGLKG